MIATYEIACSIIPVRRNVGRQGMEGNKERPRTESEKTIEVSDLMLRIVGGPDSGKEFPLIGAEMTLGRSSSADVSISDNMLSRLHAKIVRSSGGWDIVDLGSTNGTWVKGERIRDVTPLPFGTPVRIGQTLLELHGAHEKTESLDERLISYKVEPISSNDLSKIGSGTLLSHDDLDRDARQLGAIYKFQSLLTGHIEEKELHHKILELITEAIHADNAYLLSWSDDEQAMIPVAERNPEGPVELVADDYLSYSIINYVREKNEAILSVDAQTDERFNGESLNGINVRSVMCVPMMGQKSSCGLIYVISTDPERKYKEDELKLLNVIAHSAGMAIENMHLIEHNIQAQRMAAIGMTAASLSHYVKNILNGLEGSVSLLRMGIDKQDEILMNQAWDILNKNHKRLSTLVLDLLNLAKEDQLNFAPYNLSEIIVETVDLVRQQCNEERIAVEIDEDVRTKPIQAEFDSRGIHRVILNLLNNAIDAVREKHLGTGEGEIKINANLDVRKQQVEITVSDNGKGIPPAEVAKIFDHFHTGKGDRGTGLGLAVSQRIVQAHNGKIEVETGEDGGSVFRVIIPATHDVDMTQTFKISDMAELANPSSSTSD